MDEKLWKGETPHYIESHGQPEPFLTPYLLKNGKTNGAVIVFPGGGYSRHSQHEAEPIARMLNEAGFSAFVLHYRLSPYRHPAMLADALRAVRYVRFHAERFSIDPEKIGIIGFSAGGHLASTVIGHYDAGRTDGDEIDKISSRPNAAALCYAVILLGDERHIGSKLNLLGQNPEPRIVSLLSGENNLKDDCPPIFLWHTAEDEVVHVDNSLEMAMALKEKNIPFELHVFPHGIHGLGLAKTDPNVGQWVTLFVNWLRLNGF